MALKFAQMRATVVIWDIFEAGLQQTGSKRATDSFPHHLPLMIERNATQCALSLNESTVLAMNLNPFRYNATIRLESRSTPLPRPRLRQ